MASTNLAALSRSAGRQVAYLASLLVLILTVQRGVLASNQVGRIAYFNYMFPILNSPAYGDTVQIQEAMAGLAAVMFNERRGDILPALGNLTNCNKNLTIEWTCSTGGSPRVAFSYVLELANLPNFPHAIVGPKTSREAQAMSMAASNFGSIPIVANWATSPRLSSKSLFPTFTRTIPSDMAGAKVAAYLIKKLGYTRVGFIHESSDWGAGFKDQFFQEANSRDIVLKFSAYDSGNQDSTNLAIRTMKQSRLNVIFFANFMDDLREIAQAFKTEGMDNQQTLCVFLAMESTEALLDRIVGSQSVPPNDEIARLMHGALSFTFSVVPSPQLTAFRSKFAANDFAQYEAAVSAQFPPNGAGDSSSSCTNSNYSYPLTPGLLGSANANLFQDIWAWTFDTVIAVGLAICRVRPTADLPFGSTDPLFGEAIFQSIITNRFKGLSGDVFFNPISGDRDPFSANYVLFNYQRMAEQQLQTRAVGAWNLSAEDWALDLSEAFFRSGVGILPTETVAPAVEYNYLPQGLKIWGYIMVAVLSASCVASIVWVYLNRMNKVVVNAQGALLALMAGGCLIASWSILALTVDDQPNDTLDENAACMVAPVLFAFGFQLALVALIAKLWRIYVLFKSSSRLRVRNVSLSHVLALIGFFMTGETVILILWIILAPLHFERIVEQRDEYGNPTVSYGTCSGGAASVTFVVIIFAIHAIAVILTGVASSAVKALPSKYQESRYLNYAVLSMIQLYLIAVPSIAAVYSSPVGRFVITSTVIFVMTLALLLFMIVPKVFPARFGVESEAAIVLSNNKNKQQEAAVVMKEHSHRAQHVRPGRNETTPSSVQDNHVTRDQSVRIHNHSE